MWTSLGKIKDTDKEYSETAASLRYEVQRARAVGNEGKAQELIIEARELEMLIGFGKRAGKNWR